ncbi:LuxR C-terminal-related transcriptional regulator [Microbacterium sp. YY-01]|uniref:LuxR C-terminal-related transcriptional regulator n=1 Tax=Microbacterium sp. YY-01 TaxID=3421634 RepID=UPI003D1857C7
MSPSDPPPSETELVAHAVRELMRRTRFPVAFGGLVTDGSVQVTSIVGNRTRSLEGLQVQPERGLGGRAMIELRPRMTNDYRSSQLITHDYDVYVLGEGLRTLLAVPIIVSGRSRGVLYAGAWDESPVGGVATAPALKVAENIATELRVRDEVERRLRTMHTAPPTAPLSSAHREELRETFAALRAIAGSIDNAQLRERIGRVESKLLSLTGDEPAPPTEPIAVVRLSPRETDVLSCAALGMTNAAIAQELELREGTVKAYLSTAMAKLDAPTRHAAVTQARRMGLLP